MFDEIYKKIFKSRKLLTPEQVLTLEEERDKLKNEISIREKQVEKLKHLILEDSENSNRYSKRMEVHSDVLCRYGKRLEEIEITLLDK